jgi:hypothetical protein
MSEIFLKNKRHSCIILSPPRSKKQLTNPSKTDYNISKKPFDFQRFKINKLIADAGERFLERYKNNFFEELLILKSEPITSRIFKNYFQTGFSRQCLVRVQIKSSITALLTHLLEELLPVIELFVVSNWSFDSKDGDNQYVADVMVGLPTNGVDILVPGFAVIEQDADDDDGDIMKKAENIASAIREVWKQHEEIDGLKKNENQSVYVVICKDLNLFRFCMFKFHLDDPLKNEVSVYPTNFLDLAQEEDRENIINLFGNIAQECLDRIDSEVTAMRN